MRIPKREFTLENLQVYAEWVSDIFRQDDLFKDGWSEGIEDDAYERYEDDEYLNDEWEVTQDDMSEDDVQIKEVK
jgi:hypothetical protein